MDPQLPQPEAEPLRSILVVDDDPVTCRYLGAQLARVGCRILYAGDGPSALEILERDRPDLVLLDILMPGMDGFEVCRRIKGNLETNDIPVIHLTQMGEEAKEQSFAAGADDFINKPPNFVELRSRVRTHLLIKSLQEEVQNQDFRKRRWRWEKDRRARLLAVISQDNLREYVIDELRTQGYDVRGAEGIHDCVSKLAAGLPDLLILDQQLSDGSGPAFAAHLRNYARSRELPILLMCHRSALEKEIQMGETGPMDYLTKPFQPPELRVRVAVMLQQGALLAGRDAHKPNAGKHALVDPLTGAYSEAFLEAHLDLLQRVMSEYPVPVALLAAGFYDETASGLGRDPVVQQAAALLNATMEPGEALCRVADRTFVMVLPGFLQEMLDQRMEKIRQAGFTGPMAGFLVQTKTSSTVLLRRLAMALQKSLENGDRR